MTKIVLFIINLIIVYWDIVLRKYAIGSHTQNELKNMNFIVLSILLIRNQYLTMYIS
jgi:TRAP-type mannitol/chloroaromatic compound transport system permease small subunit